jgi:hypothetical protein
MYVLIERDDTDSGWHIWVLQEWPGKLPNDGYDIWADDDDQVEEWLADPGFSVNWLDAPPAPDADEAPRRLLQRLGRSRRQPAS